MSSIRLHESHGQFMKTPEDKAAEIDPAIESPDPAPLNPGLTGAFVYDATDPRPYEEQSVHHRQTEADAQIAANVTQEIPADVEARDKRVIDVFSKTEPDFRDPKHTEREAGDPAVHSFEKAAAAGLLESGLDAETGEAGYRLSEHALWRKYGVSRAEWTPETPVRPDW